MTETTYRYEAKLWGTEHWQETSVTLARRWLSAAGHRDLDAALALLHEGRELRGTFAMLRAMPERCK